MAFPFDTFSELYAHLASKMADAEEPDPLPIRVWFTIDSARMFPSLSTLQLYGLCNTVVVHSTEKYVPGSWQDSFRLPTLAGPEMYTIPCEPVGDDVASTKLKGMDLWVERMQSEIHSLYKKAPFYPILETPFSELLEDLRKARSLRDAAVLSTVWIKNVLNLNWVVVNDYIVGPSITDRPPWEDIVDEVATSLDAEALLVRETDWKTRECMVPCLRFTGGPTTYAKMNGEVSSRDYSTLDALFVLGPGSVRMLVGRDREKAE